MQIEHKTEKGTLCFVKVPDDAIGFRIETYCNNNGLEPDESPDWWQNIYSENRKFIKTVSNLGYSENQPKGFQIIGLTSEVTEEQAKMIVNSKINYTVKYFKNYVNHQKGVFVYEFTTALDSFKSLMQHLQITEEKWIVLFKPND